MRLSEKIIHTQNKVLSLLLCSIVLMGCGNSNESSIQTENATTESITADFLLMSTESQDIYNVYITPYNLKYNDETLSLESISAFQNYADYEYYLYVVLQFDFSSLSDEEYHWLMENQQSAAPTFDTNVFLTSESNSLKNQPMGRLYFSYDRAGATCIYYLLNGRKYDFSDSSISVNVSIEQDETYTASSGAEYKRHIYYYFNTDDGLDVSIADFSEIPDDIYADILLGYEQLGNAIKSLK